MNRLFAWHYVRTRVPADWEVTVYGKDPAFGRMVLATRNGVCATYRWQKRGRVRKQAEPRLTWTRHNEDDGGCVLNARAEDAGVDLSWEFSPLGAGEAEAILSGMTRNLGPERVYALHGILARVPEAFLPDRIQAYPANTMLGLAAPDHSRRVYRRWGLPEYVLRGLSLEDFFRKLLEAEGMRVDAVKSVHVFGYPAIRILFSNRGLTPGARLLRRRAAGAGWIWINTDQKRLCTFEALVHRGRPLPDVKEAYDADL